MSELKIAADSGGGSVAWKGPASTTGNANVQLTLPVDDGTANQYLKTDGSGALSWATVTNTGRKYTYGSWVATNSGTEVEFSSLTNTVQFAIDWSLVGLNANEEIGCLIGDSGGYETSGYHNSAGYNASNSASVNTSSSRWETEGTASSAQHRSGRMHFWNIKDTNHWFMDFQYIVDSEHPFYYWRGLKTLSAALDRVKFYGVSGATFDQGHMRLVTIEDL